MVTFRAFRYGHHSRGPGPGGAGQTGGMDATDTDSTGTAGAFARAMAAEEIDAALELLADDVMFHSPVVHKPYHGREPVAAILRAVAVVFEDFSYGPRYDGPDGHVLSFSARVGDRALQGVDILRTDDQGRIVELTVMVRPLSAAKALQENMAAMLAPPA
jgi:hypothetical protein